MGVRVSSERAGTDPFRLDLAIDAGRPLSLDDFARLSEAFSDSDLPYRVDVIDWNAIDEDFREVVSRQRLPLDEAASP